MTRWAKAGDEAGGRLVLIPGLLGKRKPGKIRGREPAIGLDAQCVQDEHELARVLRRMPDRALQHDVQRLLAEIGIDRALARALRATAPPGLRAPEHAFAVARDVL